MRKLVFLFAIMFFCLPVSAQDKVLTVDLAQDSVDISTGFDGAHLTLFGVKNKQGDVAVVIKGPIKDVLVRQKSSVFGIWMNRKSIKFKDVPRFYDYAISNVEENILNHDMRKEYGIGLNALSFKPEDEGLDADTRKTFSQALIRNKQAEGLFPIEPRDIVFLSDTFFKTEFYVPSNVPTGQYVIETFLVDSGNVIDKHETNVKVGQVGVSSSVYQFAHSHSLAYALVIVFIAVVAGWLSNAVRQKK